MNKVPKVLPFIISITLALCSCSADSKTIGVFTGFSEDQLDYSFDPQINNKLFSEGYFCYDDNGTVYFSNPQDNYRLYSYNGTESTVLTDIQASSLTYYNEKIYFLTPENRDNTMNANNMCHPEGIPYEYDISSGVLRQISQDTAASLTVVDGEFYITDYSGIVTICSYDINSGKSQPLFNGFSPKKCGEYFLSFNVKKDNKLDIYFENENEKLLYIENDEPVNDTFYNGKHYYFSNATNELCIADLITGEVQRLDSSIADYTFINDEMYLLIDDSETEHELCPHLYKYTPEGNFQILDSENQFCWIYSDNQNLYGIISIPNPEAMRTDYYFVKINSDYSIVII